MKIRETIRCCSFFLRTHVKISSKISIIEFNIQIKWCIIVTPSREAEKDYQGYFNSPPHKKNHIATTMINTVLFKISTHIFTRRMTATCTNTTVSNIISAHILTKRMTSFSQVPRRPSSKFQLTSSRRGWPFAKKGTPKKWHISTHILTERMTQYRIQYRASSDISTHILTKRMTIDHKAQNSAQIFQLTSSRRGWQDTAANIMAYINISTHILTKRMTKEGINNGIETVFQLTSSRRGWRTAAAGTEPKQYFNSHPHEEDDNTDCQEWQTTSHFNSHPHEEDDIRTPRHPNSFPLFQLTSSRRGWLYSKQALPCQIYFNSHPHEEDDV